MGQSRWRFPARGSETSGGSTAALVRNIFCSSVRHRRISRRLRLSSRRRGSIGRQSRVIRCSPAFCRAAAGSFACVQTRHTVSLQDRGSAGASARTAPRSISLRGFALQDDAFTVTNVKWYRFKKGGTGSRVTFLAVTYEGILEVQDPERFCAALCRGIGSGKAYGAGLMTLVGAGQSHG